MEIEHTEAMPLPAPEEFSVGWMAEDDLDAPGPSPSAGDAPRP